MTLECIYLYLCLPPKLFDAVAVVLEAWPPVRPSHSLVDDSHYIVDDFDYLVDDFPSSVDASRGRVYELWLRLLVALVPPSESSPSTGHCPV